MKMMASRVMAVVVCLCPACSSSSSSSDADRDPRGLPSSPHECGMVAKVTGGLEHEFDGAQNCAGAVTGTTVADYPGATVNDDEGFVSLSVSFLVPDMEGFSGL